METINTRIAYLVYNSGKTKTEWSKKLNVTPQFVSSLCNGKKTPSDRTILDICREFKVNEIWLRTGDGEPFQKITRKESIASFMGKMLVAETDDIRLRVIDVLSRLTVEDWEFIEKRLLKLIKESQEEMDKEKSCP